MTWLAHFWLGGSIATAGWVGLKVPPRDRVEMVVSALGVALWPILYGYALYVLVRYGAPRGEQP